MNTENQENKLEQKIKELKKFIEKKTDLGTANYLGQEIRDICGMVESITKNENTYPLEFVRLAKGNYLHKDGSIREAETMKDSEGNEYFMVAKKDLF